MRSFATVCEDFVLQKESRRANFASEWYKQAGDNSNVMNAKMPALLGDKYYSHWCQWSSSLLELRKLDILLCKYCLGRGE